MRGGIVAAAGGYIAIAVIRQILALMPAVMSTTRMGTRWMHMMRRVHVEGDLGRK